MLFSGVEPSNIQKGNSCRSISLMELHIVVFSEKMGHIRIHVHVGHVLAVYPITLAVCVQMVVGWICFVLVKRHV